MDIYGAPSPAAAMAAEQEHRRQQQALQQAQEAALQLRNQQAAAAQQAHHAAAAAQPTVQQVLQQQQQAQQAAALQAQQQAEARVMPPNVFHGSLALKNDEAYIQMHFIKGNRSIADRALKPFNSLFLPSPQPLRVTQRMRMDNTSMPSLEAKLQVSQSSSNPFSSSIHSSNSNPIVTSSLPQQSKDSFCILVAVPCGRSYTDVIYQDQNLKRFLVSYLHSKGAAGIVNTNEHDVSSSIVLLFDWILTLLLSSLIVNRKATSHISSHPANSPTNS